MRTANSFITATSTTINVETPGALVPVSIVIRQGTCPIAPTEADVLRPLGLPYWYATRPAYHTWRSGKTVTDSYRTKLLAAASAADKKAHDYSVQQRQFNDESFDRARGNKNSGCAMQTGNTHIIFHLSMFSLEQYGLLDLATL